MTLRSTRALAPQFLRRQAATPEAAGRATRQLRARLDAGRQDHPEYRRHRRPDAAARHRPAPRRGDHRASHAAQALPPRARPAPGSRHRSAQPETADAALRARSAETRKIREARAEPGSAPNRPPSARQRRVLLTGIRERSLRDPPPPRLPSRYGESPPCLRSSACRTPSSRLRTNRRWRCRRPSHPRPPS